MNSAAHAATDESRKKENRRAAREVRRAFVSSVSQLTRMALERALADRLTPNLGTPGILASYAPMGDEISPAAIEQTACASGWQLAFPRVTGASPLTFHASSPADLIPGFRGISEPPISAPQVFPDVVLVPLLVADRAGNRLGQGAGHYDRTLSLLRGRGPVLAIGLAWNVQIVDALPADPWDQPLDAIATPEAFHQTPGGAKRTA